MLSSQAKQEIISRLSTKVGYALSESDLTPDLRRAISTLASVEKSLSIMTEISRGEKARTNGSVILSLASRVHHSKDDLKLKDQIAKIQQEIESKLNDISNRILKGEKLRVSEDPTRSVTQVSNPIVELKCIKCGAPLPIPTSQFIKCPYCGGTLLIQDFAPQLFAIVNGI
ncbi:MAG: hypothetical protein QW292_09030 [Candidatus Parvarchaeota archaeon]